MKGIAILLTAALLAGCQSDKAFMRQEMVESATFIDRSCGRNQECRDRLAYLEAARIEHEMRERSARRNRFAAAMRQISENQARIAAAQAAQPVIMPAPRHTTCNRYGSSMNCQSY